MTIETKRVSLTWQERLVFRGGEPGGPQATIDGDNTTAPGPMLTLLLAAASCTGADVVVILEKMRITLRELRIEASGVRREQEPRRYTGIHLEYHLRGDGLDEGKARRAIDLSITKYCSVVNSLAPDIRVTYGVTLG
jgi:putative redox protein